MKNISNKEFNISENTLDILDGIKVTELQTNGYYYSLVKTSVLSNLVGDLERAKKILEDNNIHLDSSNMSVINKKIESLESEIDIKESNLEVLQSKVDMLINKVNELQSENNELKKLRDKNVISDDALLNHMYFLGYLNCYLTRGNLIELTKKRCTLSLEEFRDIIDEMIKLRNENI